MSSPASSNAKPARSGAKPDFAELLQLVQQDFPDISFKPAPEFRWSADTRTVFYSPHAEEPLWSLLHEIGHMQHAHDVYSSGAALVRMEVEAWESAKKLGMQYGRLIDEEYIQDCLDSYRNWQYKRSKCPQCTLAGVEKRSGLYRCINCAAEWNVTTNRFCRVYRKRS